MTLIILTFFQKTRKKSDDMHSSWYPYLHKILSDIHYFVKVLTLSLLYEVKLPNLPTFKASFFLFPWH